MTHTAEEVRAEADRHGRVFDEVTALMLRAYADLLERSPVVTDDMARVALKIYIDATPTDGSLSDFVSGMRAALEAVWPVAAKPAQAAHFDKRRFEEAPCYLCGYNGPGYYRPNIHPCAKQYHTPTAAQGQPAERVPDGWQPIETAPKSVADGKHVGGIYLLGFVPDKEVADPQACIDIVWWEPLLPNHSGGRGKWCRSAGDEQIEVKPTLWTALPAAPQPGEPS